MIYIIFNCILLEKKIILDVNTFTPEALSDVTCSSLSLSICHKENFCKQHSNTEVHTVCCMKDNETLLMANLNANLHNGARVGKFLTIKQGTQWRARSTIHCQFIV